MVGRASLQTWKHDRIDLLLQVVLDFVAFLVFAAANAIIYQSASGTPQGLVGCSRHDIGLAERPRDDSCINPEGCVISASK